ncbi:MAG: hypothetical protein QMC77_09000, partial [Methanocellales archaeon]|nr:hypothetical protein [Methanocellales archaeon]
MEYAKNTKNGPHIKSGREKNDTATSYNTAYTLRAYALALRDIAPFGRNIVYAGDVIRNATRIKQEGEMKLSLKRVIWLLPVAYFFHFFEEGERFREWAEIYWGPGSRAAQYFYISNPILMALMIICV